MNESQLLPSETQEPSLPSEERCSFADILSEFEARHKHTADGGHTVRQGTVVSVTPTQVFVDVGLKTEGALSIEDFRDAAGNVDISVGDIVVVSIIGRDAEGYYLLSKLKVKRPKDWASLEKAFAESSVIGGVVTEVVKGGLSVDIGVRAFLPASRSGAKEATELEKLVGQEIRCKIIELNVADENVVLDRRIVLEEEEAKARQKAFEELQEGAIVRGTVRSITQFGAFVDLGGIEGLLHVTDMSWGRVKNPADVLSEGDTVEVKVLKIDRDNRRVALGLKQLQPDPWSLATDNYKVGQRVNGRISRVTDFGAFVEIESGIEGLIRLSDMSWSRKPLKPKDIVQAGEMVEAVVISLNPVERRMALSLKQALGDPWEEATSKLPPGSIVEGPVVSLTSFGAFIELGDGLEGMIHISDITREKKLKHPKEALSVGQRVKAAVIEVNQEKRRIRLSMKQLEPTTADEYIAEHKPGDLVMGRLIEVTRDRAKVELGEGVLATCQIPDQNPQPAGKGSEQTGRPDLSVLTAMLSAKWKQGRMPSSPSGAEAVRAGQIRGFRILSLDPKTKEIDLELAR